MNCTCTCTSGWSAIMLLGKDEDTLKAVVSSIDNIYTSKDSNIFHQFKILFVQDWIS